MKHFLLFLVLPLALALAGIVVLGSAGDHARHETTLVVERKPADVFLWITRPARVLRWRRDLASSEAPSEGGLHVGARWRELVTRGDGQLAVEVEVTELVSDERFAIARSGPDFEMRVLYVLQDGGNRTTLRYASETTHEGFWERLFAPLTAPGDKARQDEDLSRLRALLDSGT